MLRAEIEMLMAERENLLRSTGAAFGSAVLAVTASVCEQSRSRARPLAPVPKSSQSAARSSS